MCNRAARGRIKAGTSRRAVIVFVAASFLARGSTAFGEQQALDEGAGTAVRIIAEAPLHAAVRREGARLAQNPAVDPQTVSKQGPGWMVRHPVVVGALIGTAAGAALSRVDTIGGVNHDPRVALIGTGAGAWAGLVASAAHKARSKERVGVGAKIGIAAGAVGLVVLPVLACYGAGGCGGSS